MELIGKAAGLAITAALLNLLLRRKNPEMAALLSISAVTVILLASFRYLQSFREFTDTVRIMLGGGESFLLPVLKCLAVALVTKTASDLCRDASQSALASAVETAGSICALGICLPMILQVLKQIGGLL